MDRAFRLSFQLSERGAAPGANRQPSRRPERRSSPRKWPQPFRSHLRCVVQHIALSYQGPAPFTERNFPTRFPDVRSKILNVWEMSIYKEFPIRERVRWQVRADFHNAFNHPW